MVLCPSVHIITSLCYKNGPLFSLFYFFFSYFRALLRVNDDQDPGRRVYTHFGAETAPARPLPRFPENDSFFCIVLFPPDAKTTYVGRDSDSGPFGTIGFFSIIFVPYAHTILYDFTVRRRGTKNKTKKKKNASDHHTRIRRKILLQIDTAVLKIYIICELSAKWWHTTHCPRCPFNGHAHSVISSNNKNTQYYIMYRLIEFNEDPHPYNLIVSRYVILSCALIDGALPLCGAWQGVF